MEEQEQLTGGWQTDVRRHGDVVYRSSSPWSASVVSLLAHLAVHGFSGAPRPIDGGFSTDGDETLSFVPGESLQPEPWTDDGLHALGAMLSDLHRSLATFSPPRGAVWKDWFGRSLGDPTAGFGHGDLGPWNIMAIDGLPVGIIDWDTAGPIDPRCDLAQAAWLNVQLHDNDVAEKLGLGGPPHRARQLEIFLDAYGLERAERVGFVDKMVEVAVRSAAEQAIDHGVTEQTTSGLADNGYPFVWGMAWRIRSARWMLQHRSILDAAIGI